LLSCPAARGHREFRPLPTRRSSDLVREMIIDAVPASLKGAIGAGIGLFIAFIGLKNGGIVVSDPATFVALGDFSEPGTLLAVIGVIITGALMAMRVKGSILYGIAATRSEEHTSELQSRENLVCRLLLEKKNEVLGELNAY